MTLAIISFLNLQVKVSVGEHFYWSWRLTVNSISERTATCYIRASNIAKRTVAYCPRKISIKSLFKVTVKSPNSGLPK